jgi:hypothetical protein
MSVYIKHEANLMAFCSSASWTIMSSIEASIKEKMETAGTPLRSWNIRINRGILTGLNEAFIIGGDVKSELVSSDPNSAKIIRPILRGRDIKRYAYTHADLWLIATFPSKHYDIEDYPAVKRFLLSFGMERLEQSGKKHLVDGQVITSRKKTNNKWFETQDSISYWDDFSKPKIVWGNLCLSAQFAFVDNDCFINAPSPMIVPGNKYLLAILNSRIADWYIRQLGVTRNGGYFEYKPMFVEQLPVPMIDDTAQQPFILLVDQVLSIKNSGGDTTEVENEINRLAYQLYGLEKEEIQYIENHEDD